MDIGKLLKHVYHAMQNSATENIDILDIVHEPYIKLQRWKLLLQRYAKYIPQSNQDNIDIATILSRFDKMLNDCEETLKQAENLDALLALEKKIEGVMVFLSSDTHFIKDGPVVEIDPRSKRQCLVPVKRPETPLRMFLFNDVILLCNAKQKNKKYSVCSKIPLATVKLMSANCLVSTGLPIARCFILRTTKKALLMLFQTTEEKDEWEMLIKRAAENLEQRRSIKKSMEDGNCSDFTCAPVWLPDDTATSCTLCCRDFNLICRRHHCRGCGIIMCSHCTPGKLHLPYEPSTPAIVCRSCYMRARRLFPQLVVDDGSEAGRHRGSTGSDASSASSPDLSQFLVLRGDSFDKSQVEEAC